MGRLFFLFFSPADQLGQGNFQDLRQAGERFQFPFGGVFKDSLRGIERKTGFPFELSPAQTPLSALFFENPPEFLPVKFGHHFSHYRKNFSLTRVLYYSRA